MTTGITGQKTRILRTDEKYDATFGITELERVNVCSVVLKFFHTNRQPLLPLVLNIREPEGGEAVISKY
jgi:hypothetical protein